MCTLAANLLLLPLGSLYILRSHSIAGLILTTFSWLILIFLSHIFRFIASLPPFNHYSRLSSTRRKQQHNFSFFCSLKIQIRDTQINTNTSLPIQHQRHIFEQSQQDRVDHGCSSSTTGFRS